MSYNPGMRAISLAFVLCILGCGSAPAPADMAGGTKLFGEDCVADADCQSGMCRDFQMQTIKKCTKACTAATQANDCPIPPSSGTCNANLVCKF
jgi:hypothetical protein